MNQTLIHGHLEELEWVVSKGFHLRHHPFKAFPASLIADAITLIRIYQRLDRREKVDGNKPSR
ncbi:hypothetical protein [Larkinella harenae]